MAALSRSVALAVVTLLAALPDGVHAGLFQGRTLTALQVGAHVKRVQQAKRPRFCSLAEQDGVARSLEQRLELSEAKRAEHRSQFTSLREELTGQHGPAFEVRGPELQKRIEALEQDLADETASTRELLQKVQEQIILSRAAEHTREAHVRCPISGSDS
mmetsp:Transcript_80069/g.141736  ORF Transcript_80069/g.141736 Transcript_80069/m.141736 type:complete len:159 (-) Transcript_80069:61-537(-)